MDMLGPQEVFLIWSTIGILKWNVLCSGRMFSISALTYSQSLRQSVWLYVPSLAYFQTYPRTTGRGRLYF
jgi:hypothetical protein